MRHFLPFLVLTAQAAFAACSTQPVTPVINRGQVMANPRIHFVFWGSYWRTAGSADADLVVRSYSKIAPIYFSGLEQYGVNSPELAGMTIVDAYEPPSVVRELDVALFLGTLAKRPGTFYVVLLPKGTLSSYRAFHSTIRELDGSITWYTWVSNNGGSSQMLSDLSHELVEGLTDPDGKGVQTVVPVKSPTNWSEIADACEAFCSPSSVQGVPVVSYWSQRDGACIAPGVTPRLR